MFLVLPAIEKKTEEEYFIEAIGHDNMGIMNRNRLCNDNLPSFFVPVCITLL